MALHGDLMLEAANARIAEWHREAAQERLARVAASGNTAAPEQGLIQRLKDLLSRRYAAFRPIESARS